VGALRRGKGRVARRLAPWVERARAWLAESGAGAAAGERVPRAFLVFLLLFGCGMILISLVGDQGFIAYLGLQREATALRRDIQALETRQVRLQQEIRALREDPAYIELLARQELGLVRPGEVVIQLPRPQEVP